jgi:hypothetical protein
LEPDLNLAVDGFLDLLPTEITGVCNPQTVWQGMVVGALTFAPTLWITLKPRFGGASLLAQPILPQSEG